MGCVQLGLHNVFHVIDLIVLRLQFIFHFLFDKVGDVLTVDFSRHLGGGLLSW